MTILIVVLLQTLIYQSLDGVAIASTSDSKLGQNQTEEGVFVVHPEFEVQTGEKTWMKIKDPDDDGLVQDVVNQSTGRFSATFLNLGSAPVILWSFFVSMYNSTSVLSAFQHDFPGESALQVIVPQFTSKTQVLSDTIIFPKEQIIAKSGSTGTASFSFGVGFQYSPVTEEENLTEILFPGNFSVNIAAPPVQPPEFLVMTFFGVNILIVAHLSIGYLGRRRSIKTLRGSKYH